MVKRTFTEEETAAFVAGLAKQKKMVSAGLLCYDPSTRNILIVMANYKKHWSLPGGVCDPGEAPQKTAVREAFEEVGVNVSEEDINFVGVERTKSWLEEGRDRLYFVFAAPVSQDSQLTLQESEIEEVKWVSASELREISGRHGGSLRIAADWIENGTVQYADFGL